MMGNCANSDELIFVSSFDFLAYDSRIIILALYLSNQYRRLAGSFMKFRRNLIDSKIWVGLIKSVAVAAA